MLRPLFLAPVALAVTALAFSGRGSPVSPAPSVLALAPSLAVDKCIEVDPGETFQVAISIGGVSNLMAWDIYYAYDSRYLEVVDKDVRQLLNKEPNSKVFDFSDPVPNTTGLYRVGAADTGGSGAEEDGGGVLAVLTLRALDEGSSWSALVREDRDGDGMYEYGPTLTEVGGIHIGDTDGDGIFDGSVRRGQIAVGRLCKEPAPTPYVDPDVVPVEATLSTPAASTATGTDQPDSGAPETETRGETETPGTGASASPGGAGRRSPTPEARSGSQPGSGDGDSSGGLSPLLATVIGAGGGAAIVGSYFVLRAVRRPA